MLPAQIGVLLLAVGVEGVGFTSTVVLAGNEMQLFFVAVTLYTPDCAGIAPVITGFWLADVKPPGPVHAHVTPEESALANNCNVVP